MTCPHDRASSVSELSLASSAHAVGVPRQDYVQVGLRSGRLLAPDNVAAALWSIFLSHTFEKVIRHAIYTSNRHRNSLPARGTTDLTLCQLENGDGEQGIKGTYFEFGFGFGLGDEAQRMILSLRRASSTPVSACARVLTSDRLQAMLRTRQRSEEQ
ncbi:hypothetical protein EXIGLDRAFT_745262 [Exidia glandulosa HHB12029]|uniref:Uncharacterized protein n=1 Tax=Exidia glandulosa HHB12029 TaxID=1314781 RepID=A0A165NVY9_EXIGL|nr:hypothetical protein EXIGLDRAFT_745262 [Exidia glandulosa HHB12029]